MHRHEWLVKMLDEMADYSRANKLKETEGALAKAWKVASKELATKNATGSNVHHLPLSSIFRQQN